MNGTEFNNSHRPDEKQKLYSTFYNHLSVRFLLLLLIITGLVLVVSGTK
jgi:hypothetical protein